MSSAETKDDKTVLATSIRAGVLDTTLDILQTAAGEAILRLGREGLDVAVMDSANVMVHFVDVDAAAFERVPEGQFALGTNLTRLQDTIGKAAPESTVTLALNTETRRLNVTYGNVDVDLAMIDPDSIRAEPPKNDIELPNSWAMAPAQFKDAVDVVDMVTTHVRFDVDAEAETLTFRGKGDTDEATVTFDPTDLDSYEFSKSAASLYGLEYINDISSVLTGETVRFRAGEEFPLRVLYEYADGHASVETMLAPRIESD